MKIYLGGKIPKGDIESKTFFDWRKLYEKRLTKLNPRTHIIDPYHKDLDEGDYQAVLGSDSLHIKTSDLVIINAEEKLGAGTAMEFVIAKYYARPLITILPKDTHHRRSNVTFHGKKLDEWIHPFIHEFSDVILSSIEELKKKHLIIKPKTIEIVDNAIIYYTKKHDGSA